MRTRKQQRLFLGLMLFGLLALLFFACAPLLDEDAVTGPQGTVLFWHSWQGQAALVLTDIIERFEAVYPGVRIIQVQVMPEALEAEFIRSSRLGFGPDLLLAPNALANPLAERTLIRPLNTYPLDAGAYLPEALATVSQGGRLYGLPLSLDTVALLYNRNFVTTPPATLEGLLEEARAGRTVLLEASFTGGVWGIQAFGGRVTDETGRVVLDEGGFAEWLAWLAEAQEEPDMILHGNFQTIYDFFAAGNAAYLVGGPNLLPPLREALGQDAVGVVNLPSGPAGPAGPYLRTEALLFNAASSDTNIELALLFGTFLTNREQQRRLLRELGRVPSSARVRIDPRINPAVAEFREQAQTAVPLQRAEVTTVLDRYGRDAYTQVLEGVLTPQQSAQRLTERANADLGFEVTP